MTGALTASFIVLITLASITVAVTSYFRMQRHRADAVALASYRKLAEEAVANQVALRDELSTVSTRLGEVERLLRSVDE